MIVDGERRTCHDAYASRGYLPYFAVLTLNLKLFLPLTTTTFSTNIKLKPHLRHFVSRTFPLSHTTINITRASPSTSLNQTTPPHSQPQPQPQQPNTLLRRPHPTTQPNPHKQQPSCPPPTKAANPPPPSASPAPKPAQPPTTPTTRASPAAPKTPRTLPKTLSRTWAPTPRVPSTTTLRLLALRAPATRVVLSRDFAAVSRMNAWLCRASD